MKAIELHLVSWNRPKMTELVVRTIKQNTKPTSYRLTVLDNNSDLETKEMLARLHDNGLIDEIHLMQENAGLEAARQYLLLNSTFEDTQYFICIDNDCLPPPIEDERDWIERLYDLMQRYEGYAAIACRTQVMIGTGNIFEDENKEITDFPHPGGSLRIMDVRAVRQVGGWDREVHGRGAEERYICGKLREAGYKTGFATHIRTLHLFGDRAANTDRWGYNEKLKPEDTGHSDIWHPALENGDTIDDVKEFAGEENAKRYFSKV